MTLQRKLDAEEWDLLSVVTDPILLGEFLRNTADGSPVKDEWPKLQFTYRWYQKDLLSDTNERVAVIAGRAVGKCSPASARVYIHPYGYVSINDLIRQHKSVLFTGQTAFYTVDFDDLSLIQRRGRTSFNGTELVLRIITKSGFSFDCTTNHPLFTDKGWLPAEALVEGMKTAVMTWLPHTSEQKKFTWEELRWFGYVAGEDKILPERKLVLKFQRHVAEMRQIALFFDANLVYHGDNTYSLMRRPGPLPHYARGLISDLQITHARSSSLTRIPLAIKAESLQQLKYFLEAYFSRFAKFTKETIRVAHYSPQFLEDIQELLLRYRIESRIERESPLDIPWMEWLTNDRVRAVLVIDDPMAYYQFFSELEIPGVTVKNLKRPTQRHDPYSFMRFEEIVSIIPMGEKKTYAITVPGTENYISDGLLVHNSFVLEDKQIFQAVNCDTEFPQTKEALITTANLTQLTPLLDRIIMRFSNSSFLRDFLRGQINRSKGTLDFPIGSNNYRLYARIAGNTGQSNMVGLHLPKIMIDEVQLFSLPAYTQLEPALNSWEQNVQQFVAGVPNGIRDGSLIYLIDQRLTNWKRYHIPAHENPYFTQEANIQATKKYGGEDSADYQNLILGRHGEAAFSIISRESIVTESFPIYGFRYSQADKSAGKPFRMVLDTPILDERYTKVLVLAVDTGYADPTVAQILGQDAHGVWRTLARYRLTRIPFPEQAEIIDWLDSAYKFTNITVDLGSGGGGIGVVQDLMSGRFAKSKNYEQRISGVRFGDYLTSEAPTGDTLRTNAKSFAGQELARMITDKELRFSEVDAEGISQVERVAYQRRPDGTNQYYVVSERGAGKTNDDHIFASYVVFVLMLLTLSAVRPRVSLAGSQWI